MSQDYLALFLTWTTYGSWLPGDQRGYVSNTLTEPQGYESKENRFNFPYARDHAVSRRRAQQHKKWPTQLLSPHDAQAAALALLDTAQQREWHILRGAIMANHLHLLVSRCHALRGPAVRRILKANAGVALSHVQGKPQRWWTEGGSDRYLFDERAVEAVMQYIDEQDSMLVHIVHHRIV